MGIEDRDYMTGNNRGDSSYPTCPKTGHWVGVENCSACNSSCARKPRLNRIESDDCNMGNIAAIYELGQVGDDCCLESAPQDIEQSKNENQNPYPRKVSGMGDLTLAEKTDLQICPTCKKQSLFLNQTDDTYECLNQKCSDYRHQFLKISVDRYYEQLAAEKKALDELSDAKTHAWVGNQYYDEKKKKWCDGDKPIRAHQVPAWLVVVLAFVIISVLVTLILNYYHPGSHFIIF